MKITSANFPCLLVVPRPNSFKPPANLHWSRKHIRLIKNRAYITERTSAGIELDQEPRARNQHMETSAITVSHTIEKSMQILQSKRKEKLVDIL